MMRMLRGYYYWFPSGTGIWGIVSFSLIRLLLAAIIIVTVISLTKLIRRGSKMHTIHDNVESSPHFNSSLQILNDRLAKSEITIEEYHRLKTEIFRQ